MLARPQPPRVIKILLRVDFNIAAGRVDVGHRLPSPQHVFEQLNQERFFSGKFVYQNGKLVDHHIVIHRFQSQEESTWR